MNSALKNFVINHWLKPVAWLVLEHSRGQTDENGSKMGGRGSCRAKTTANSEWQIAIGQIAAGAIRVGIF